MGIVKWGGRGVGQLAEPVSKVTPRPTFHFLRLMSVPTVPITMVKNSQLGLFNGLMKHTQRAAPTGGWIHASSHAKGALTASSTGWTGAGGREGGRQAPRPAPTGRGRAWSGCEAIEVYGVEAQYVGLGVGGEGFQALSQLIDGTEHALRVGKVGAPHEFVRTEPLDHQGG